MRPAVLRTLRHASFRDDLRRHGRGLGSRSPCERRVAWALGQRRASLLPNANRGSAGRAAKALALAASLAACGSSLASGPLPNSTAGVGDNSPPAALGSFSVSYIGELATADEAEAALGTSYHLTWKDDPLSSGEQRSVGSTADKVTRVELIGPRDRLSGFAVTAPMDMTGLTIVSASLQVLMGDDFVVPSSWLVDTSSTAVAVGKDLDTTKAFGPWTVHLQIDGTGRPPVMTVTVSQ